MFYQVSVRITMKRARIGLFFAVISLLPLAARGDAYVGTGFFVTSNGYVATNYHVIENAATVAIRDSTQRTHDARVVLTDSANDMAILKVDGTGFAALPVRASNTVRKGETVYTLGFPDVPLQGTEPKLTNGIVSSLSGLQGEPNAFQVSVPIQPGNSGGPLFDASGSVIGIVIGRLNENAALRIGAGLPENVNYALKSN